MKKKECVLPSTISPQKFLAFLTTSTDAVFHRIRRFSIHEACCTYPERGFSRLCTTANPCHGGWHGRTFVSRVKSLSAHENHPCYSPVQTPEEYHNTDGYSCVLYYIYIYIGIGLEDPRGSCVDLLLRVKDSQIHVVSDLSPPRGDNALKKKKLRSTTEDIEERRTRALHPSAGTVPCLRGDGGPRTIPKPRFLGRVSAEGLPID